MGLVSKGTPEICDFVFLGHPKRRLSVSLPSNPPGHELVAALLCDEAREISILLQAQEPLQAQHLHRDGLKTGPGFQNGWVLLLSLSLAFGFLEFPCETVPKEMVRFLQLTWHL